jgi:pyruvate/2-oxoglutarate dehydrogenase complex dihydrolipoamide dehydrogenase (E3) component
VVIRTKLSNKQITDEGIVMTIRFDAIVIGTGQAGPALAARLSEAGMKVAVIERNRFGGTCVNTGCIPTKTLVASAYAAQLARRAAEYGVSIDGKITVDMEQVKKRKDEISGRSNKGVEEWMRGLKNGTVYHGHARFESARTVRVNDDLLEAERIFINVGGRALVPPMPGLDQVPYLTNSSMMDVDFLPEHLIIIGGSYIGLEFGQMYRRFGADVTIVEKGPRLIGREDEDVSNAIQEILQNEGVQIRLNAECMSARRHGERIAVGLDCAEASREVVGSHLLLAVGRVPNTDDLALDKAGIETDSAGYIKVDNQLRTNIPGIWALGDCNRKGAFTHTSYNDYEIVAANILDNDPRKVSDRITTYALFIDPPLGRAGMTAAEARASGRKALIATRHMTRVARAVEKGETQGFIKVVVDAETKEILGAAILGVTGDEVIHLLLDSMYAKAPYTTISRAMHIHPTVSELIPTLLQSLQPLA